MIFRRRADKFTTFLEGTSLDILKKNRFMRTAAVLLAVLMTAFSLAGCGKDKDAAEEEGGYSGVLSKIKLGMPQKKVLSINNQKEMYYESDTVLWCINPDTDLMELRQVIPADQGFSYCDDSVITYEFKHNDKDNEDYLTSYTEEVTCLIDRDVAQKYYDDKVNELRRKYNSDFTTTQTGTEGVDVSLVQHTELPLSSFVVYIDMTLTYDTVEGVDAYYGTHYSITVKELANKAAVPIAAGSAEDDKDAKKDKDKDKDKDK